MAINNQKSIAVVTENPLLPQHPAKPIYKKPKTSLFLDPRDIQNGLQSIPESNIGNSGIMS